MKWEIFYTRMQVKVKQVNLDLIILLFIVIRMLIITKIFSRNPLLYLHLLVENLIIIIYNHIIILIELQIIYDLLS